MIEPTDDMEQAYEKAWQAVASAESVIGCAEHDMGDCPYHEVPGARRRAGLAAVLAIVERDLVLTIGTIHDLLPLVRATFAGDRAGVDAALARFTKEEIAFVVDAATFLALAAGLSLSARIAKDAEPDSVAAYGPDKPQRCSCPRALCYSDEARALDLRCRLDTL